MVVLFVVIVRVLGLVFSVVVGVGVGVVFVLVVRFRLISIGLWLLVWKGLVGLNRLMFV